MYSAETGQARIQPHAGAPFFPAPDVAAASAVDTRASAHTASISTAAHRLATVLLIGVAAAVGGLAYLGASALAQQSERDFLRATERLARTLGATLEAAWHGGDATRVQQQLQQLGTQHPHHTVRWVPLDAAAQRDELLLTDPQKRRLLRQARPLTLDKRPQGEASVQTYQPVHLAGMPPGAIEVTASTTPLSARNRRAMRQAAIYSLAAVAFVAGLALLAQYWLGLGRPLRPTGRANAPLAPGSNAPPRQSAPASQLCADARAPHAPPPRAGSQHGSAAMAAQRRQASHRAPTRDAAWQPHGKTQASSNALVGTASPSKTRGQLDAEFLHADRLASFGHIAIGLLHDLGTPLNVIAGHAALVAQSAPKNVGIDDNALAIQQQTTRIAQLVRHFLNVARRRPDVHKRVHDLATLIDEALGLVRPVAQKRRVSLLFHRPMVSINACVNAARIQQTLNSLLLGGIEQLPAGGAIALTAGQAPASSPDASQRHVYVSLYTYDAQACPNNLHDILPSSHVTGSTGLADSLRLAVCRAIIEEHGGCLQMPAERGRATRLTVYLPGDSESDARSDTGCR